MDDRLMDNRLKYRAWLKDDKIMRDVFGFDCNHVVLWNREGEEYIVPPEIEDCILLQCTGRKDDYGTLIFDGDIVEQDFVGLSCGAVVWSDINSMWYAQGKGRTQIMFGVGKIKVIGNIYENPELLEVK